MPTGPTEDRLTRDFEKLERRKQAREAKERKRAERARRVAEARAARQQRRAAIATAIATRLSSALSLRHLMWALALGVALAVLLGYGPNRYELRCPVQTRACWRLDRWTGAVDLVYYKSHVVVEKGTR